MMPRVLRRGAFLRGRDTFFLDTFFLDAFFFDDFFATATPR